MDAAFAQGIARELGSVLEAGRAHEGETSEAATDAATAAASAAAAPGNAVRRIMATPKGTPRPTPTARRSRPWRRSSHNLNTMHSRAGAQDSVLRR